MELLQFDIADEKYVVALDDVDEILFMASSNPVPASPDFLHGVFNLHGVLLPLIELKYKLQNHQASPVIDKQQYPDDTRILVVSLKDCRIGVITEGWRQLMNIEDHDLHQGVINDDGVPDWVNGIGIGSEGMLQMIRLKQILNTQEQQLIRGLKI